MDLSKAKNILKDSFGCVEDNKWTPKSDYSELIQNVILGHHKTYRYILINALLAKAVDESINPLVLQVQSKLEGAFDARLLCHSVLVEFEREYLHNAIGGSNEPFLNKPARFSELSTNNNVRKGYDTGILLNCIEILSHTTTSQDALTALKDALHYVLKRPSIDDVSTTQNNISIDDLFQIQVFIDSLLTQSIGGEVCAVLSAVAFDLYYQTQSDVKIMIHSVNQSGASSKECSDIDIYQKNKLINCAEIKDKDCSNKDIDHAAAKVKAIGLNKMFFILGPHAKFEDTCLGNLINEWNKKGVIITVVNLSSFVFSIFALSTSIRFEYVLNKIKYYARLANTGDKFLNHFSTCIGNLKQCLDKNKYSK